MKLRIHSYIAVIALIAVLVTAGCLEPADTAANATPEPCETCTVPEDNSSQYAKLDPELADRVSTMRSGEKVVIWIWLTEPSGTTYAAHEAPVIDFLEGQNATVAYASQYAPVVFAEVSRETIRDLCERPDVVLLDITRSSEPALNRTATVPVASAQTGIEGSFDLQTYRAKALEHVSAQEGIPVGKLTIINEAFATFPLTGRILWGAKMLDEKSSAVYGVYLDEEGEVADIDTAKQAEAAEKSKRYGKLDPELAERVSTMRSGEKVVIWIWLTEPSGTTYATHAAPVIDFLEAQNSTVVYVSQYAPVVFAEVSRETIWDLCKRSDVVSLDISRSYEPA